jgi:YfiH family protein
MAPTSRDGLAIVERRRRSVAAHPWTWLRQVHGVTTVTVEHPGAAAGAQADAAVTACPGAVLSVVTADCAAVALWSDDGVIGVAHAGWRGLSDGVLEAAVAAVRRLSPAPVHARVGPLIGPCCYEFGRDDLDRLVARFGARVRARTRAGRDAFDLREGVAAALERVGVDLATTHGPCTACDGDRWYSHRARGDAGRQALAVWRDGR